MNKFFILLFILAELTQLSSQEIKYFHSPGWYPFTMRNENTGDFYGVSIDLMNEIAKEMNTTAIIEDVPWKRGFLEMDNGLLDICAGAYDNAERRSKYLFSVPFMENEIRIYVNKGEEFSVNELQDLLGKKIGIPRGASYGDEFDAFMSENMTIMETKYNNKDLVKILKYNMADCIISDYYDMGNYLKNNNLTDNIIPLDYVIDTQNVYLLLSKKSQIKISDINNAIYNIKRSGKMEEILNRY